MKKYYRFFGGFLNAQEKWLNKMSADGYRLVNAGKMTYEFEECISGSKEYRVEFVGEKSRSDAESYRIFLEDMGYRVFYKNINLNFSAGKLRFRPWADKGGRIAANSTTFNRELMIVEKDNDGMPFELHTSYIDKIRYYSILRRPWIYFAVIFGLLSVCLRTFVFGAFAVISLLPCIVYGRVIAEIKKESLISED